jgi:hypothetical protein
MSLCAAAAQRSSGTFSPNGRKTGATRFQTPPRGRLYRISLSPLVNVRCIAAVAPADLSVDTFGAMHSDLSLMTARVNGKASWPPTRPARLAPLAVAHCTRFCAHDWCLSNVLLRLEGTLYTAQMTSAWPSSTSGIAVNSPLLSDLQQSRAARHSSGGPRSSLRGQDHRPLMFNFVPASIRPSAAGGGTVRDLHRLSV